MLLKSNYSRPSPIYLIQPKKNDEGKAGSCEKGQGGEILPI